MDFHVILIQGYRSRPNGNPVEVWLFLHQNRHGGHAFTEVSPHFNLKPNFPSSKISKCVLTRDHQLYVFTGQEEYMDVRRVEYFPKGWCPSPPRYYNRLYTHPPLLFSLAAAGDIIYLLPHKPSSFYRGQYEPESVAYLYNTKNEDYVNIKRPGDCPHCLTCNGSTEAWHPHFCATLEGGTLLATVAEGNTLCLHKYDPHRQTWSHCCQFKDIPKPTSDHEYAMDGDILFFSFSATASTTALYVIDVTTGEVLKQYKFRIRSICGKQSRFLVALSHNRVCYLCYDRNILYITKLKLHSGDFDKVPEFFPPSGSNPETVIGKCMGKYGKWTGKPCKYVPVVTQWARIEKELEESVPIEAEGLLSCILYYTDPMMTFEKSTFPVEPYVYYKFNLRMEFPAEVRIDADGFEDALFKDCFEDAWFPVRLLRSSKHKALIRFENLRTDEVQELFKMAGVLYVRPSPPKIVVPHYQVGDKVDGWYRDSWRKGVIFTVLNESRYVVQLDNVSRYVVQLDNVVEEQYLCLDKSEVRIHQDWTNGSWVIASQRVQEIIDVADPVTTSSDSDSDIEEYLSTLFADPREDLHLE